MTSSPATESALLPCPFCTFRLVANTAIQRREHLPNPNCPLSGYGYAIDRKDLDAAWNRRPPVSSPVGEDAGEKRNLTAAERETFDRALRRSVTVVAEPVHSSSIRSEGLEKK